MKQLITILFAVAIASASCKKQTCYQCETANEQKQFCEGDLLYDAIDDGQVVTDNTGAVYDCH